MKRILLAGRSRTVRMTLFVMVLASFVSLVAWHSFSATAPPPAKPKVTKETLKYGEREVVVERTAEATTEDLKIPFYDQAEVLQSYTYRVSTKEGKFLSYYAMALLTSKDAPEVVAQKYTELLPGKPKAELLKNKEGTRLVLAVASKTEVRSVSISQTKTGSDIRLTRATKHTENLLLPGEGPGGSPRRHRIPRGGVEA